MFDDYLWKCYVYRTTFSNVKYQDLCATTNLSKIKYLQNRKRSLKYLCKAIYGFAPFFEYVFRFKQSFIIFCIRGHPKCTNSCLSLTLQFLKSPISEPTLELHSRAVPSVVAHHHVSGPNTGRNSGGRGIKKSFGMSSLFISPAFVLNIQTVLVPLSCKSQLNH